jgi:stage V sporulation protein B
MTEQTNKLVKGAMLLSFAGMIAKIFSALYRIPLARLVGQEGMGYYETVYPIYSLLVSALLIGIPNAISKLTSEKIANDDYYNANNIFKYSRYVIVIMGVIISLFMFFGANFMIERWEWKSETKYVIRGLSLSPIFISITGTYKGYFQGMQKMLPTALTQIIENVTKVILGISITYLLVKSNYSVSFAVGGAAIGTTLGFLLSAVYIYIYYLKHKNTIKLNTEIRLKDRVKFITVTRNIIKVAIPITIASASYSIMRVIDSNTVFKRLTTINKDVANKMMGQLGYAFTIINVPLTISLALMITIVPAISIAVAKNNYKDLINKIVICIRFSLLLALPAAIGIIILSEPLMNMLYHTSAGHEYLMLLGICLVLIIIGQALAAILQGMGKYYIPLVSLFVSVIIKYIINYYLIASDLQLMGAVIGSICYYAIYVLINYIIIKRATNFRIDILKVVLKPMISTIIMGISVFFVYSGVHNIINSNTLATLISIIAGIVIYGLMLIITKTLKEEDFVFIPYHESIVSKLKKLKLI